MKKYSILLASVLFAATQLMAQPDKKGASKEKAPTQKEMEDMMKEAQKMMKEMSPGDKKMMDSLGIKMPSLGSVPQVGDQALAAAFNEKDKLLPTRKANLIASLPKKTLSTQELLSFLKKENNSIAALIKPESKKIADKLMEMFKDDPNYGAMIASASNGLWAAGYKEAAVYLLGKATEALPNADNYNNYGAYLTMMGAAHIALPILLKLNSVHKNNSTVLNNIGQAWLQLGDEGKGEKYIDSAIMIYSYHPQANYTKCLLLQSRGKIAEATNALNRSLKHSVTETKLNKLKELDKQNKPRGYNVPRVYYSTSFKLDEYAAMVPQEYAFELGEQIEGKWKSFKDKLNQEIEKIEKQIEKVKQEEELELKVLNTQIVKQGGAIYPPYYRRAAERYTNYVTGQQKKVAQDAAVVSQYAFSLAAIKTKFLADMKAAEERFRESKSDAIDNCPEQIPIINAFLQNTNKLNQGFNTEHVRIWMADAYNLYYYAPQLASVDASALKSVLSIKLDFLKKLRSLKHEPDNTYSCKAAGGAGTEYKMKELPDYDEVHCNIENVINAPGFGKITMRCNNMTMELNPFLLPFSGTFTKNFDDGHWEEISVGIELKAVSIEAGANFDKDGNFEKGEAKIGKKIGGVKVNAGAEFDEKGFKKGSIELGISNSLKLMPKAIEDVAPVDISLQNKLGVGIEIGKDMMISDYYVKQSTSGTIADNIDVLKDIEVTPEKITLDENTNRLKVTNPETASIVAGSATISADSRWGVNSGFSGKASGTLSALTIE